MWLPDFPSLFKIPLLFPDWKIPSHFPGVCSFSWNFDVFDVNSKETGRVGATESEVWIGNLNVKAWKTTEHKLHKIWRSLKFCTNSGKRAHPKFSSPSGNPGYLGFTLKVNWVDIFMTINKVVCCLIYLPCRRHHANNFPLLFYLNESNAASSFPWLQLSRLNRPLIPTVTWIYSTV